MSRTQKTANSKLTATQPKPQQLTWKDKILPEDFQHLKNVFDLFDEDHSGLIDPQEINKIMNELGDSRKGSFAFGVIESLKTKGKPINFEEFLELVCPKVGDVRTKEGIKTIFHHIDKEEDEILNFQQIKQLAKISGDAVNDDQILEMLHSIHINRQTPSNQHVNFDNFYEIVAQFHKK